MQAILKDAMHKIMGTNIIVLENSRRSNDIRGVHLIASGLETMVWVWALQYLFRAT